MFPLWLFKNLISKNFPHFIFSEAAPPHSLSGGGVAQLVQRRS